MLHCNMAPAMRPGSRVVMLRGVLREGLREGLRGGSHAVAIADWNSRARCRAVVTVVMVFNR